MKPVLCLTVLGVTALAAFAAQAVTPATNTKETKLSADSAHAFKVKTIDGEEKSLAAYKGKALLIVNTASKCGYTPQYAGLEELHQKYKGQGLAVLAFPANDFGAQEPGTNSEIKGFCTTKYKTTFDLFEKVSVKGAGIDPLFAWLTSRPGMEGDIKWNFGKFLLDKNGKVVARYGSGTEPMSKELTAKIEETLK